MGPTESLLEIGLSQFLGFSGLDQFLTEDLIVALERTSDTTWHG